MVERVRWGFLRSYGPETPYITPLESPGLVGREFFHHWAKENGARIVESDPGAGILPSLSALASKSFDPEKVTENVRRVFDAGKTQRYRAGNISWGRPWARIMHRVYDAVVARGMQQLSAPVADGFLPTVIGSHIDLITPQPGGWVPEYRSWTRTYERNGEVFYTAAVFPFIADGKAGTQSYLCCVLPLSHANLAVCFQPENFEGNGFKVSTNRPGTYCGGIYLVLPGRSRYIVMPAPMNEQLEMRERESHSGPYVEVKHQTWAFGSRSYTLSYELRTNPKPHAPAPVPTPKSAG